jgi:hypothetical protein
MISGASGRNMKKVIVAAFVVLSSLLYFAAVPSVDAQSPLILEALYATSTAPGYEKNGPHNLFSKGTWSTMPGAAINEGVMLYFESPSEIASMKIELPDTSSLAKVKSVRLYADGTELGQFKTSDSIRIDKKIRSLYIRIAEVEGFESKQVTSDIPEFDRFSERYTLLKGSGFSRLLFFDKKGLELKIIPPRLVKGSVKPSSTLLPEEAYHVGYLFDSRKDSGWVEGNKGSGSGESLVFNFDSSVKINRLKIWNGLLLSDVHYKANERVKAFTFASLSEKKSAAYKLPDSQTPQIVQLDSPLEGKAFQFVISDIYAGTAYKDTVISEIMFGDEGSWFSLYSDEIEKRKAALLTKVKGTLLSSIVDRFTGERYSCGMGTKSKSLLLRSDSSFVIWMENEDDDQGNSVRKTRVLDGFWNITSLTADKATVVIMGRNYNLSEQFSAYEGNQKTSAVSIFMDTLTVSRSQIKGAKFFGSIGL